MSNLIARGFSANITDAEKLTAQRNLGVTPVAGVHTQLTSVTNDVQITTLAGQIVTFEGTYPGNSYVRFRVNHITSGTIKAGDLILVHQATNNIPGVFANNFFHIFVDGVVDNFFWISIRNNNGGDFVTKITINYRIFKHT